MYLSLLNSHQLYPEAISLESLFQEVVPEIPGAAKFKNADEMAGVVLQRRLESVVNGNKHLLGASRQVLSSTYRRYVGSAILNYVVYRLSALLFEHMLPIRRIRKEYLRCRRFILDTPQRVLQCERVPLRFVTMRMLSKRYLMGSL